MPLAEQIKISLIEIDEMLITMWQKIQECGMFLILVVFGADCYCFCVIFVQRYSKGYQI